MPEADSFRDVLVIIPAHNEEGAIRQVIEAVKQAVPAADVLVIDDLSTDGTVNAVVRSGGCEVVIGSRYLEPGAEYSSLSRRLGIIFFRLLLWPILGKTIHDPTSGFIGVNRRALEVLSRTFPLDYPEVELLVVLQRRRFRFEEIPAKMHPRLTGKSKLDFTTSVKYMIHVLLGVFVNILRFDGRLRRRSK